MFHENIFDYTSTFEELNTSSIYLSKKAKILGTKVENIIRSSYEVNTITLAHFLKSQKIRSVDVIKIDTEGHELKCLQGLFPTDCKIKLIQIEKHNDDMRLQHNYGAWKYVVKNSLKMLIYTRKPRFFAHFCLVFPALATLCCGLDMYKTPQNFSEIEKLLETNHFKQVTAIQHGFGNLQDIIYYNKNLL